MSFFSRHRKVPSFSFSPAPDNPAKPPSVAAHSDLDSEPDDEDGRSRSRNRTLSASGTPRGPRDPSAEGLRREETIDGAESDIEASTPVVCPSNAFDSDSDESDEEEDLGPEDPDLEKNTEANASAITPIEFLQTEAPVMTFLGEGPNLLPPTESLPSEVSAAATRRSRSSTKSEKLALTVGRPVFEKNRCTVTIVHGDPEKARIGKRRTRSYVVASDLSEESLYAIQWAIGTVLRDGDECYIVSVIETDSKFDADEKNASGAEKRAKIANQKERQINASMLSRQATALLERTSLNVKVHCQAVHAKNARHMLVDIIDYFEPTLVIIGTRGLTKIKGMLLGSVSNYLIQKSSSPVMVTRRPLRLARTVHKKLSSLSRESRVPLSQASIEKESHGGEVADATIAAPEPANVKEQVQALAISDK